MKKSITALSKALFVSFVMLFGCSDDDPAPQLSGESKVYQLSPVSNPAISGTVTFAKREDNATLITIQLNGTSSGATHPAHIHANAAAEGGAIILDLTPVNGSNGRSETVVEALNDGTEISYEQLLAIDGYINVHLSESDLATLVAQGDVGINELTTTSKTYPLGAVSNNAISGTAQFTKRVSGFTLVTINLTGTSAGVTSPAHIHINTAAEGGAIAIDLASVNGASGKSFSHIEELNDGTPITYDQLMTFNGYINVHETANTLNVIIAQGDIGRNELTAISKTYRLNAVSNPAISGTAQFTKRVSGETLVSISLTGTTAGVTSPAHIHVNTAAAGGGIAVDLAAVNGATGKSATSVRTLNNGTAITYDELLNFDGYINVHQSAANLATIIAQGNIGANEVSYDVSNSGSSDYVFSGGGLNAVNDPSLTLKRGRTYIFTVDAPGHPFFIKITQTTGNTNAYNSGVTNNGVATGTISFTVPLDAPSTLFYNCSVHASMTGVLNIVD